MSYNYFASFACFFPLEKNYFWTLIDIEDFLRETNSQEKKTETKTFKSKICIIYNLSTIILIFGSMKLSNFVQTNFNGNCWPISEFLNTIFPWLTEPKCSNKWFIIRSQILFCHFFCCSSQAMANLCQISVVHIFATNRLKNSPIVRNCTYAAIIFLIGSSVFFAACIHSGDPGIWLLKSKYMEFAI